MNHIVLTRIELNKVNYIVFLELDSDRYIVNLQLFNDDNPSLLNNIYSARVDNIVPNINSAFIKIDKNKNCFLSLNNSKDCIYTHKNSKKENLCVGDEILVQIIKDAVKTKEPVVSTKLSLYGQYSILTTGNTSISVSKKINKTISKELKDSLSLRYPSHEADSFGIIVRTNAKDITYEKLYNDIDRLVDIYINIKTRAPHTDLYSCLYESPEEYCLILNSTDLNNIDKIITDQPDIYENINSFFSFQSSDMINLYDDKAVALSTLYNIKGQLDKLINNKIWLKSGANIIIEQLETLTVIDVNTAKNSSNKVSSLQTNMEAAAEILRQIRLRNISGMIIIDFINMNDKSETEKLISFIKSKIKLEDNKCDFIDITKLGLVELTRKKTYKSLKEQINFK